MKRLKFGNKIMFFVNSLVATLLLVSYLLPYVPPKSFSLLSVLSLGVPLLIILNILFCMYWLLRVKKQLLLSLVVLLFGIKHINAMYKFSPSTNVEATDNFSVMSFNVRMFNRYQSIASKTVKEDIITFIKTEAPEIICLQEYRTGDPVILDGYYSFNALPTENKIKWGQAIFSKYPIINSGSLEFPNTNNNAIFVDIVKAKDTIRVYTLHLQSAGINTSVNNLKHQKSTDLFKQVGSTFKAQQSQVELILKHRAKCTYKTIITGDFNNTAYSYIYKEVKQDLLDTFKEAGNGFGRTYDFKFFPVRIDFILVDELFSVNGFKTFDDVKLSDHHPIKATLNLH